jgi:hypothetical protein
MRVAPLTRRGAWGMIETEVEMEAADLAGIQFVGEEEA